MDAKKRGPVGPQRAPEDDPKLRGGLPPAEAGGPTPGEPSLMEARGPRTDEAAAAADDGENVDRDEDPARQPGQSGGRKEEWKARSQGSDGAGARRTGTAAGLPIVAEDDEEDQDEGRPVEAGGAAAAQGQQGEPLPEARRELKILLKAWWEDSPELFGEQLRTV